MEKGKKEDVEIIKIFIYIVCKDLGNLLGFRNMTLNEYVFNVR